MTDGPSERSHAGSGGHATPPPPPPPPGAQSSGPASAEDGRTAGQTLAAGARVAARGARGAARGTARGTGRASRFAVSQAKRAADAQGAAQSGLNRLIYLHACNSGGDAAVAISLATTVFFAGATSDARSQVALFLLLTMLPFAIVAPLIGPFLDRFSHGRRWAMGATFAIRGFLCWVLATAVADDSVVLYPAALGVLVSSKAYDVTRAAAIPRLQPPDMTLVKTNARASLAGVVGASLSAPVAALCVLIGPQWGLRYAFCVFVVGTIAAILVPAKVDSSADEQQVSMRTEATAGAGTGHAGSGGRGTRIPATVAFALRANCGPRFLSGFLTMFLAFLLRDEPLAGWEDRPELLVGLVVVGAGAGNALGIFLASVLKRVDPAITVTAALIADAAMVLYGAIFYGLLAVCGLGLMAGLCQAFAKVSLDSTIQGDVPARVQASAFARSNTTLQLAWVLGGFVGIGLPLQAHLGLGIGFALLAAWTTFVLAGRPGRRRRVQQPAPSG